MDTETRKWSVIRAVVVSQLSPEVLSSLGRYRLEKLVMLGRREWAWKE